MSEEKETKEVGELKRGQDMTPEELEEYYNAFQLVEDSIEGLEEEDE